MSFFRKRHVFLGNGKNPHLRLVGMNTLVWRPLDCPGSCRSICLLLKYFIFCHVPLGSGGMCKQWCVSVPGNPKPRKEDGCMKVCVKKLAGHKDLSLTQLVLWRQNKEFPWHSQRLYTFPGYRGSWCSGLGSWEFTCLSLVTWEMLSTFQRLFGTVGTFERWPTGKVAFVIPVLEILLFWHFFFNLVFRKGAFLPFILFA